MSHKVTYYVFSKSHWVSDDYRINGMFQGTRKEVRAKAEKLAAEIKSRNTGDIKTDRIVRWGAKMNFSQKFISDAERNTAF